MHLFFDTMTYLHYRGLDEVDLAALAGTFPHAVLFPRVTLRELDKHKSQNRSPRAQDKARRSLRRIEEWVRSGFVREGVAAEYYSMLPAIDYPSIGLDSTWADDVLIATVLQYRSDHPDVEVALVTDDTGVRLKARQLGLDVRALPEEWRLKPEPDAAEVENRELAKQLEAIQNAQPKLAVRIKVGETSSPHATFTIGPPPVLNDAAVAAKLEELKAEFPKQHPSPPTSQETTGDALKALAALGAFAGISTEEYERYNMGVDEFLREYADYIREAWAANVISSRTINFQIEIRNSGTSPADDVDVHLHFPDGFTLSTEEPEIPEAPRPPHAPRTAMEMLQASVAYSSALRYPTIGAHDYAPSSFSIRRTSSYDVDDHFQRVKHGGSVVLPEMFLTFDSFEDARSFSCHYTVRPANLPEAVVGDLHFVVKKHGEG